MKDNIEYRNINDNNAKKLADVFKEINDMRRGQTAVKDVDDSIDYFYELDGSENLIINSKKKMRLMIAIDLAIMITILFGVFANYIFAFTSDENQLENVEVISAVEFEANSSALVIEDILLENISILKSKDLIEETREIEYETKYVDDNNLPLDEEIVDQEGVLGYKNVTIINTYENEELVEENMIDEVITDAPVEKVIRKGTSKFLKDKKIHIEDTVYVTSNVELKEKSSANSTTICDIPQSLEAKLMKIDGDWAKVKYDEFEGYVLLSNLTSSNANPEILDANRIQKIKLAVSEDMPLNKSSGLTLEDFKRILSNNSRDRYGVFQNAAEDFYNADKNYNVNGVFLASIGIHESAWGTSTIAVNKKNLFGYGAYDSSPYESAFTFETYYNGIEILAKSLTKNYLNPAGTVLKTGELATGVYYNGNTAEAVNVRYASDKEWHNKVFKYMSQLYNSL